MAQTEKDRDKDKDKKIFIDEFCSNNGCTPQEKFFLEKTCKGQEMSESDWKKKIDNGNKS